MFAERTNWKLSSNKLTVCLESLRRSQTPVLDLTESNPTRCGFAYPHEKILSGLSHPENNLYTPGPQGSLPARQAVCQYYQEKNLDVRPERIFLTASTSEAYSFLFRLLANPGESVVFPRPSYPLFEFLGDLNDLRLDFYSLIYDGGWTIDFKSLLSVIGHDTRALVLVNPNNPTGSFVKQQERENIIQFCQERKLPIICDEVFYDFSFAGNEAPPGFVNTEECLTFTLGGLSKTLGLPQMKLSWIIISGPQALVDDAVGRLEIIADTYLSVNTPAQNALKEWLSLRPVIQKEIRSRIQRNRDFLINVLAKKQICQYLKAEGGWYAVLKLPGNETEEHWALELLEKDHVYVHPGYFFNFNDTAYLVLSLLPKEKIFQEGLVLIMERAGKKQIQEKEIYEGSL